MTSVYDLIFRTPNSFDQWPIIAMIGNVAAAMLGLYFGLVMRKGIRVSLIIFTILITICFASITFNDVYIWSLKDSGEILPKPLFGCPSFDNYINNPYLSEYNHQTEIWYEEINMPECKAATLSTILLSLSLSFITSFLSFLFFTLITRTIRKKSHQTKIDDDNPIDISHEYRAASLVDKKDNALLKYITDCIEDVADPKKPFKKELAQTFRGFIRIVSGRGGKRPMDAFESYQKKNFKFSATAYSKFGNQNVTRNTEAIIEAVCSFSEIPFRTFLAMFFLYESAEGNRVEAKEAFEKHEGHIQALIKDEFQAIDNVKKRIEIKLPCL